MIFFFLSLIGISISICDIYISGRSFVELAHEEGCEEREFTKWNVLSINCIFFVLPIWSLPVRITAARVSWQLTLSHHYIKELVEPHFPKAELLIKGMARFITMFFLPPTLRRSLANKSMKKHHQVHHIFQTVVEIILIIVAVIFQNYLGLVSMSCGLLGAFLGLFKFHKIDTLLNFLAVCFSFVLLGIESAHFECVSNNLELMFDIFLFTFMADFIRLKSVLHSYIESKEKTYLWLQERELYSDMEISSTLFFILSWKIKALKPVKYNPEH